TPAHCDRVMKGLIVSVPPVASKHQREDFWIAKPRWSRQLISLGTSFRAKPAEFRRRENENDVALRSWRSLRGHDFHWF
ncbi:MAG: hypothetical protein J0I81_05920, partial [Hyphomicrobium sp.]|nr:hypothetical protein [Hyphomicrobium sp.]